MIGWAFGCFLESSGGEDERVGGYGAHVGGHADDGPMLFLNG